MIFENYCLWLFENLGDQKKIRKKIVLKKMTGVIRGRSSNGQFGGTNDTEVKSFYSYTYKICSINNYKLKIKWLIEHFYMLLGTFLVCFFLL